MDIYFAAALFAGGSYANRSKSGDFHFTYESGRINIRRIETLCKVLSDIKNAGHELILVSSGAIGLGVGS